MSSEIVKGSVVELPLWQRYADQFPVRENLVYLNHAAVAPLSRRCADALKHLADDSLHYGSLHYSEWLAVYDGLRAAVSIENGEALLEGKNPSTQPLKKQ